MTNLEHHTDAPNHPADFISSNFGQLGEQPNTNRQGTTAESVTVLSNDADIYMPVQSEQLVYFADKDGSESAQGIYQMSESDRNAVGLIKMSISDYSTLTATSTTDTTRESTISPWSSVRKST